MKRIYLWFLIGVFSISACADLDVPPPNFIGDETLLTSESGMEIYLARMYSRMPFEDFKYQARWGMNFSGWLNAMGIEGTGESVSREGGLAVAFTTEDTPYWSLAYTLIRDANYLIETLPQYESNFAPITYNHYLGEAYFARAVAFSAMARRFGGIPLVTSLLEYPGENIEVPRSTEEETWNQVSADYDRAVELLQLKSPKPGYSNKYVALSYKAEAMLYAGSVAKYNETVPGRLTGLGLKTGVRVIGFETQAVALEASKRYFKEAYLAAREVINSNLYSLYKRRWAANDPQAQYQNMVDMLSDLTSLENIYVREYVFPITTHGYDAYSAPFIFKSPLASGSCPTVDFLELFDGFPRYPDGSIRVTTGNSNTQGTYLMYDEPMDFFANVEPRLRSYVIFPGDMFKNREIEVRAGVFTGATPINPFFNDYSFATAETRYQSLPIASGGSRTLFLSSREGNGQQLVPYNGGTMTAAGENGPFYDNGESTNTGLYIRKWLNPDPSFVAAEGRSAQPFILMRYAEVLLTAAEAAVELSLAGEASPDGADLMQVATSAVNEIRERAGATLLVGNVTPNEAGRNIVRKERRKELAYEHKTKWDLRRWRVQHYENRDGFWGETRNKDVYSNNSRYRFRGLYPFFSTQTGQYFFDARFQWVALKTYEYNPVDYYFAIPGGEVSKSLLIDQQPNR